MRILVIAYEFPPSPSPGSLRWCYLARELAANGHEVEVLAPRLARMDSSPALASAAGVRIERVFAGPLAGILEWRSRRKRRPAGGIAGPRPSAQPVRANWKYRFVQSVMHLLAVFLYPDSRAEWRPWAARALRGLLDLRRPDIVISTHEPATTLQLGLLALERDIPWIVDLGDPVLAPYTPPRWRRRAARLESVACRAASHVVVTTEAARRLLMRRHGLEEGAISVMTQGFEDRNPGQHQAGPDVEFDPARLELLYSGRFYAFRKPDQLLAAVLAMDGVRLSLVAPELPAACAEIAELHRDKVRYLGHLSHSASIALQRRADVLVGIGNDGMAAQVPGKFYEYLGTGRPVLHLLAQGDDPCRDLVESLGAGWTCRNDVGDIRSLLEMLMQAKHNGAVLHARAGSQDRVAPFGWSRIGERYSALIEGVVNAGGRVPRGPPIAMVAPGTDGMTIDSTQ